MIKKTLPVLLALSVLSSAAFAEEEHTFTPFFDFSLAESVYVPTGKDTFFSGGNINTSVGLLTDLNDAPLIGHVPGQHALFALYNFAYDGPGFRPQDQGEFAYQDLNHSLSAEYRWKLLGPLRLRPGFSATKSYVRTGANETWGTGLYDNNSAGGQLALDYLIPHGMLTVQGLYRQIKYPNFTDLLRVFQNANGTAETSGGLQDQNMKEASVSLQWRKLFMGARYDKQDYVRQTVVESNGVYGNTLQANDVKSAYLGFTGKLWAFEIQPQATITKNTSNQNFLNFKFFGDPNPTFSPDWYSYTEYRADVPFYLNFTEAGSGLTVAWSVVQRNYTDRFARDSANNLTGALQKNTMVTLTGGFRFRINEVTYMKITGGVVNATSNNKFEAYLPYNYTGIQSGLSFGFAY